MFTVIVECTSKVKINVHFFRIIIDVLIISIIFVYRRDEELWAILMKEGNKKQDVRHVLVNAVSNVIHTYWCPQDKIVYYNINVWETHLLNELQFQVIQVAGTRFAEKM